MTDLNKVAIDLAEGLRASLEDEVVSLDVAIAQGEHKHEQMRVALAEQREAVNDIRRDRSYKTSVLYSMTQNLLTLRTPREGFPGLDDEEYEQKMADIRLVIQNSAEEEEKRAAWSE